MTMKQSDKNKLQDILTVFNIPNKKYIQTHVQGNT